MLPSPKGSRLPFSLKISREYNQPVDKSAAMSVSAKLELKQPNANIQEAAKGNRVSLTRAETPVRSAVVYAADRNRIRIGCECRSSGRL